MVDCTGLENRQGATLREFESHRLRQDFDFPRLFGGVPLSIKCPLGRVMLYFSIGHILLYRKYRVGGHDSSATAIKNRPLGRFFIAPSHSLYIGDRGYIWAHKMRLHLFDYL